MPEEIDAEGYDEVYIWGRQFAVPLAVAKVE